MGNFQANYHEMFADTAGGNYPKTGKFHESIIHAAIYKKKLLSEVVTPVLHIRLGTVLKLYQILPTKTQQKDTSGKNTARIEKEQQWERMSANLLELEVENVNNGSVFINSQHLIDHLKAALSVDWQTLDDIVRGLENST